MLNSIYGAFGNPYFYFFNVDIAETIRPALVGLLIQKICPINKELSVITLSPEMEQIIINTFLIHV